MKLITIICFLLTSLSLYAETGKVTGLKIPRFVSLKSNDVNLRVGPSTNYPITLKYISPNLPVEIIDEFDVWRQARDHNGTIGWLHKSLIKGERYILTGYKNEKEINLYNRPNGNVIGVIKKNNLLELNECLIKWCKVKNKNIKGWIAKQNIWGVYSTELFNKKFYQPIINQYWKILNYKWMK